MRYDPPRFQPAGDSALLIEFGDEVDLEINARAHALAQAVRALPLPGLGEAVPTYRSLLLHYDPGRLTYAEISAFGQAALARAQEKVTVEPRVVEVPVCYGGEFGIDLDFVAHHNSLSPKDVIQRHTSTLYPVYMLGFSPGFAYLGGLSPAIATPRLSSPRTEVPGGSVGIAGKQTGIYPIATPGGWQLIGRTPLRLFDPRREPPALLQPGDRVRFVPIDPQGFEELWEQEWGTREPVSPAVPSPEGPNLEVIQPGLLTTVQDLGRRNHEAVGVPVAGAMDLFALQAANRLVGNPPGAAGLEITIAGPTLRATADCLIAVGGADLGLRVNGRPIPIWMSAFVRRGWQIDFSGLKSGCRAYLAVAGGIAVPPVLGSAATYLRGGFGGMEGRALKTGDVLPIGPVTAGGHLPAGAARELSRDPIRLQRLLPAYSDEPTVAVIPGPQSEAFSTAGLEAFFGNQYLVSPTADRMGYRLQGPTVSHQGPDQKASADIVSDGIVLGAIQVPADQQPIVMMADRQTTGGYPKIGVVASADIPLLAQCLPGKSRVRFQEISVEEAQDRYRQLMQGLNV